MSGDWTPMDDTELLDKLFTILPFHVRQHFGGDEEEFREGIAAAPMEAMSSFPESSYEIPLARRIEGATHEFHHPRLGIHSTNKHDIPITTQEAKQLLSLLVPAPADWRNDEAVRHAWNIALLAAIDGIRNGVIGEEMKAALDNLCVRVASCGRGTEGEDTMRREAWDAGYRHAMKSVREGMDDALDAARSPEKPHE